MAMLLGWTDDLALQSPSEVKGGFLNINVCSGLNILDLSRVASTASSISDVKSVHD